jgi:hypothetical protein
MVFIINGNSLGYYLSLKGFITEYIKHVIYILYILWFNCMIRCYFKMCQFKITHRPQHTNT